MDVIYQEVFHNLINKLPSDGLHASLYFCNCKSFKMSAYTHKTFNKKISAHHQNIMNCHIEKKLHIIDMFMHEEMS